MGVLDPGIGFVYAMVAISNTSVLPGTCSFRPTRFAFRFSVVVKTEWDYASSIPTRSRG